MAQDHAPLVNGNQYAWADIRLQMLGRNVTGISGISYESKREKVNWMGAGSQPVARTRGNREYSGSITLHAYEVDAIEKMDAPKGVIEDIKPFNITVSYFDEELGLRKTDILEACEFTGNKREANQGDTELNVELELIIGNIRRGV